jgi:hypothetical protein
MQAAEIPLQNRQTGPQSRSGLAMGLALPVAHRHILRQPIWIRLLEQLLQEGVQIAPQWRGRTG